MKCQPLTVCLLVFALCACSRIIIFKHPDYNFPPTDPESVLVHERAVPDYAFVIIGRISLDTTWTENPGKDQKKIKRMAAQAGADGILVTGLDIDIDAFNQYVRSHGRASVSDSDLLNFAASVRTRPISLEQTLIYGYLIKRT